MTDIEDRYYSMPEIMKYLGISRDTALRWIATKQMPAHKIGKNWKFKVSEIDEWVNSGMASKSIAEKLFFSVYNMRLSE